VSTTRSGAQSASSRKGSVNSQPDLEIDDFFLDRLEPVVISGGGLDQSQLVRTQSGQSGQSGQSAGSFSVGSNSTPSPVVIEVAVIIQWIFIGIGPFIGGPFWPITHHTQCCIRKSHSCGHGGISEGTHAYQKVAFPRSQRHEFTVVGQSDAQGSMLSVPDGGHERTALRHPPTAAPELEED